MLERHVNFHRFARRELQEAYEWYLGRRQSAALGFIQAIDAGIATILEAPNRWPLVSPTHHRYRLTGYRRYSIVYEVLADEIFIVAVAHSSRKPFYWARRRR